MSLPGDDPCIGEPVTVITGPHDGERGTVVARRTVYGVMKYGVVLAWDDQEVPFYFAEEELRF